MKTVKTKNIGQGSSARSRSVDFKFFEEIKENYFTKKSQKDSSDLVFGQSLYKCILNDLKQSSLSKMTKNFNSNTQTRQRKVNNSNLLIASKFDLNVLSGKLEQDCLRNRNPDAFYSKRNSVLFEALDLKNVNLSKNQVTDAQTSKFKELLMKKKSD